jgi:hypothetical protein
MIQPIACAALSLTTRAIRVTARFSDETRAFFLEAAVPPLQANPTNRGIPEPSGYRKRFADAGIPECQMPYFSGVLTGVVLTVLVVFLIDHLEPEADTRDIVNWEYVGATLGASVEKVGEDVRQEVHEATAPDQKEASPSGDH